MDRVALELECYRAVESTTKEWVAWDCRQTDQDQLLTKLSACNGQQNDSALCDQLQQRLLSVNDKVHNYESVVSELKGENEGLQLRTEELKAKLALPGPECINWRELGRGGYQDMAQAAGAATPELVSCMLILPLAVLAHWGQHPGVILLA